MNRPSPEAPLIMPSRCVLLDPVYAGDWLVAGDVDGDGAVELVSAQNYNENDIHYTSAAVAQRLDGSVLWRWGDPTVGRKKLHHDVACQIHDWDGDGRNEVVLLTKGYLVALDGATGAEKRRLPIPPDASDCLVFADLSGRGRATDVLVKTRYSQIWAYNQDWRLLWTVERPAGHLTAHQPRPLDLDGDGRDEIMAGYALLNPDGSLRWVYRSNVVDLSGRGHLDTMRVLRTGAAPEEFRLALTCCGANNIAVIDGLGRPIWEVPGYHFESLSIGRLCPDIQGLQIAVDIDHVPHGVSPIWVFDEDGHKVSEFMTDYSRIHHPVDWFGQSHEALVMAHAQGLFDCRGRRLATFVHRALDGSLEAPGSFVKVADMNGDGRLDLLFHTQKAAYIFENQNGPVTDAPLGTGLNVTLY